jgi:hypothetical protein
MTRSKNQDEDEARNTLSEYMSMTMSALRLLRGKGIRTKYADMAKKFEADLEEEFSGNPYKPSDGANSYKEEVRTEDERRHPITASATLEVLQPALKRWGVEPLKRRK